MWQLKINRCRDNKEILLKEILPDNICTECGNELVEIDRTILSRRFLIFVTSSVEYKCPHCGEVYEADGKGINIGGTYKNEDEK